jgi:hypothetical protein
MSHLNGNLVGNSIRIYNKACNKVTVDEEVSKSIKIFKRDKMTCTACQIA